jgi:hypothetical protein
VKLQHLLHASCVPTLFYYMHRLCQAAGRVAVAQPKCNKNKRLEKNRQGRVKLIKAKPRSVDVVFLLLRVVILGHIMVL